MMMVIENEFNLKDEVYLVTDSDQKKRIVSAIKVEPNDIMYQLCCGTEDTWHYEFEISKVKDYQVSG